MSDGAKAEEFEFMAEVSPRAGSGVVQRGLAALESVIDQYQAAQEAHGPLVPISTVAAVLGVTPQRVGDLLNEGRMISVEVCGRRWVAAKSVRADLVSGPKASGRPRKVTTAGNTVRALREMVAMGENAMVGK
jgi:hypothetical protein